MSMHEMYFFLFLCLIFLIKIVLHYANTLEYTELSDSFTTDELDTKIWTVSDRSEKIELQKFNIKYSEKKKRKWKTKIRNPFRNIYQ